MRTKYTNEAAEKLAEAGDRLEERAARVRKVDREVALEMLKEAARLQRAARHLQTQASRVKRHEKQGRSRRGKTPRSTADG